MASKPLQRSKKYLEERGYYCEKVEQWITRPGLPGGGFRKDFLGIIDLLAFHKDHILGVQCCAGSGYSAHVKKLMEEKREQTELFLSYPYTRLEIHAWRQLVKVRGKKAKHWVPKICVIDESDLCEHEWGKPFSWGNHRHHECEKCSVVSDIQGG